MVAPKAFLDPDFDFDIDFDPDTLLPWFENQAFLFDILVRQDKPDFSINLKRS